MVPTGRNRHLQAQKKWAGKTQVPGAAPWRRWCSSASCPGWWYESHSRQSACPPSVSPLSGNDPSPSVTIPKTKQKQKMKPRKQTSRNRGRETSIRTRKRARQAPRPLKTTRPRFPSQDGPGTLHRGRRRKLEIDAANRGRRDGEEAREGKEIEAKPYLSHG